MEVFGELEGHVATLRGMLPESAELADALRRLDDDALVAVMETASAIARRVDRIEVVGAGIVAERSSRAAGQAGLAQSRGHRNTGDFLQSLIGESRSAARRRIRVGQAVLDAAGPVDGVSRTDVAIDGDEGASHAALDLDTAAPATPWHAPLSAAVVSGTICAEQHDAIRSGLGEPPSAAGTDETGARITEANRGGNDPDTVAASFREAWAVAAEQLVGESARRTVEELRSEARFIRDRLDPDGAQRRFLERHEQRSFRMWMDADGRHHGSIAFDDDGYSLVRGIHDTALRPRRGGPRFVDEAERESAHAMIDDPRTNDQLSYDLVLDLVRAGSLADAKSVHGTRQAGVRVVSVVDAAGRLVSARTEDGLTSLTPAAVEQRLCDTGTVPVAVDMSGDPLNVGREHRLFTPAQRVALAVRDGGCRWAECDRPAPYCEAHHIDPYSRGGRTDLDRGILLCRFHHMQLHHGGWRITRDDVRDFVLHDPGGARTVLHRRLALEYAFPGGAPPGERAAAA